MALDREIDTYNRRLGELLPHQGKYVVIHADEVVGTYDGFEDALQVGYERFGDEAFLVRKIRETEPILTLPRSLQPCPSSPKG
jgi:hypothetical protein